MRILAIVDNHLRAVLERNIGCEVDFYVSWQNIDPAILPTFGCVIASGAMIEDVEDPLVLWGIASAIRYFNVPAVFVDVSFEAGSLIPRVYPHIKLITYQGDTDQFLLQLRTCAPQLFFDNPRFSSSFSASANAWRFQETAKSSELNVSLEGSRQNAMVQESVQQSAMTGSFGPVSSIPLGMQRAAPQRPASVPSTLSASGTFRKEGMGPGRMSDVDDFDFKLDDISSVSSISGLEGISDILDAADPESSDAIANPNEPNQRNSEQQAYRGGHQRDQIAGSTYAGRSSDNITVYRAAKDVQSGKIEFGSLIRVAVTVMRLKLTGVMEIQSDTRSVRLEFRRGAPYASCSSQAILSALCWSTGEFNFNDTRLLSMNSTPVDLWKLIQTAVREQFPLQPLYRILEGNAPHYVARSNYFEAQKHPQLAQGSEMSDGEHTLLECLRYEEGMQEEVAREIYLAYLCDDICLFDRPVKAPIIIEYEVIAEPEISSLHAASSHLSDAAADNSQINAVRTDLLRVRASFDTDDGYKILGLQPGCGVTALDDAYYAWINRYHSDRFVRYKDPSFVKLANELLMLMNSAYSKISKAERANSGSRLGVGRARLSTINTQHNTLENRAASRSPKLSQSPASSQSSALSQSSAGNLSQRPRINSSSDIVDAVGSDSGPYRPIRSTPKPNQQVMTMSEILAKRTSTNQPSETDMPQPEPQMIRSPSVVLRAPSSVRKSSSASIPATNATAQQHFATAKKKLALGLSKDALIALDWALQTEPDNLEFQAFKAYATFLVDPTTRDTGIEKIQSIIAQIRNSADNATLFNPYYFVGKMQMAAENYPAAKEALNKASKLNPSDVDTQRSIRYVDMQLEKQKEAPKNKGLLSSLKDRLTKKL